MANQASCRSTVGDQAVTMAVLGRGLKGWPAVT